MRQTVTLMTDTLLLQESSPGKASMSPLSLYTDPAIIVYMYAVQSVAVRNGLPK